MEAELGSKLFELGIAGVMLLACLYAIKHLFKSYVNTVKEANIIHDDKYESLASQFEEYKRVDRENMQKALDRNTDSYENFSRIMERLIDRLS